MPPLLGAVIGYVTNDIAVRMLFKPYKKWKIGPIGVPFTPGVIPKQREKIARGIGKVVSEKLLNAETVKENLKSRTMKNAIIIWLRGFITDIINYPIPTIGEFLTRLFKKDFDFYYKSFFDKIEIFISKIIENPENHGLLQKVIDKGIDAIFEKSVDELLGADIIQEAIAKITSESLKKSDLQERIFDIVESFFNHIFEADKPLREVIPDGLVEVGSNYIKGRLPGLLINVSKWLDDPKIKDIIRKKILQVVYDYVKSLNFLQSVLAGLLRVEDRIADQIPFFIENGKEYPAALLRLG